MVKKTEDEVLAEKVAESKQTAAHAAKKQKKNKAAKKGKEISDKLILEQAAKMPGAGAAKSLIAAVARIDKINEQKAALGEAGRLERAGLKEQGVDMVAFDLIMKMRKMDTPRLKSFKASTALIQSQLGMELSEEEKASVKAINEQREASRKAMTEMQGAGTGKEIGSNADKEEVTESAYVAPAKNVGITPGAFRTGTH